MKKLPERIAPTDSVLLVVDYQDKLLPFIDSADSRIEAGRRMIETAKVLELPILLTEQYPAGIGRTCAVLREALGDIPPIEKVLFSAYVPEVIERMRDLAQPNVIVVGIEAHVCVQQTVLDLLRAGYTVFLCADAIGSRRPMDRDTAIERCRQAGAIVTTTESAIFELLGEAGTDQFKQVLKIVK